MHLLLDFFVTIQYLYVVDLGVRLLDKAPLRLLLDHFWTYSFVESFSTYLLILFLSASLLRVATRSQFRALSGHWRFARFGNILLFVVFLSIQRSVWGEGSTDIMVSGGAVFTAKQHDVEPEKIYGSPCYANIPKSVRKRSYLRAARRAHRFGFTWYRGRLVTKNDFPCPAPPMTSPGPSCNVAPPQRQSRRRLTCLSWNAGGLSQAAWDLTLQWIDEQRDLDLIMIQECGVKDPWYFYPSQTFDSLESFELALTNVGHLMDCLEANGMILNTDKTVALCKYLGRQSIQLMKKHILRTKAGTFLRIPRCNGTFTHIKLVSEYTYLGVKISYGNSEWLTMSHRLKAGDRTQQQLHKMRP
eukprot:s664_g7.t1